MGDENIVPSSNPKSPNEISEQRASLIRKWLVRFGELYTFELTAEKIRIWISVMNDLSTQTVDAGFRMVEKTFKPTSACPFPTPAHLREFVDQAKELTSADEVETAWHETVKVIQERYHPDLGWRGPQLVERLDRAIRAANGVHYVWSCSEADLVWAKKRFVECYQRDAEMEGARGLIAPTVLQVLKEAVAPKALSPFQVAVQQATDIAMQNVPPENHPRGAVELTEEEFNARKEFLRKQAEQLAKGARP